MARGCKREDRVPGHAVIGPHELQGEMTGEGDALLRRIAYVTSAFPTVTETFVLREVCALEQRGWTLTMFALKRSSQPGSHSNAVDWLPRVFRPGLLPRALIEANLYYLVRMPFRLLGLWARALWWHRSSVNFLVRVPIILLQAAVIARELDRRAIKHLHAHFATHPALAALAAATLVDASF